jgi:alginate O-acetyltransferase complex protein AlgI
MLFQTPEFALLFIATVIGFYGFAQRYRLQVLAVASLGFYAVSGALDFALLVGTIGVTYVLSRQVRKDGPRWPIFVAVIFLIASLGYFKYDEFLYDNLRAALGSPTLLNRSPFLSTILPLGISFYSFQIVGYFIDLHKGRADHAKTLLEYTVFVAFFAQLIAGPIMRAKYYLPQLRRLEGGRWSDVRAGGLLVLQGLLKKVVLADFIAQRVDERFTAESFSQPEALVAAGLFAFQIYFDFSGYVDIALGLGRMLGIKLKQNFRTPYLSGNPTEFWSRWHITLSNWFRDYLYIPLGGNRHGRFREVAALIAVMAVAGLWHGAGWTFVLWGLIHGVYLAVHRFIPSDRLQAMMPVGSRYKAPLYQGLGIVVFFTLTVLAWIPFRAPDLSTTVEMYRAVFSFTGLGEWVAEAKWMVVIGGLFLLHVVEWWISERTTTAAAIWVKAPVPVRGMVYAGAVLIAVIFSGTQQTFIYFRF